MAPYREQGTEARGALGPEDGQVQRGEGQTEEPLQVSKEGREGPDPKEGAEVPGQGDENSAVDDVEQLRGIPCK